MSYTIESHNPEWKAKFDSEALALRVALGGLVSDIHHIGSTSIPKIVAKPIIDILVEVNSLDALDRRTPMMEQEGYEAMGEFGIPKRRYFRKDNASGVRQYHVHAFLSQSEEVARHIAFRDYLLSHSLVAKEYSDLKTSLAEQYPSDVEAYIDGKDAFVKSTEKAALAWRSST